MRLPIRTIGDPCLREVSRPLTRDELAEKQTQKFIDDLIETMREAGGAGIAAVQVGRPLRICVIEVQQNKRYPYLPELPLRVLINPELTLIDERTAVNYDGCLSVPDLRGPVERPLGMRVRAWDRNGKRFEVDYFGLAAVIVSHECDHLNGLLFVDHVADEADLCSWATFERDLRRQEVEKWTRLQALFPVAERPRVPD